MATIQNEILAPVCSKIIRIKICCWFDTCFLNPSEKVSKRLHLSALVVENVDVCYNEAAAVETVVVAVMDFDVVADFVQVQNPDIVDYL